MTPGSSDATGSRQRSQGPLARVLVRFGSQAGGELGADGAFMGAGPTGAEQGSARRDLSRCGLRLVTRARKLETLGGYANADESDVSGRASSADERAGQRDADRSRAIRLRQRREEAGEVRVQAWMLRGRAAYARDVLRAAAAGATAQPPAPAPQAELDAAGNAAAALPEYARSVEASGLVRAETAGRDRKKAARVLAAVPAEAETTQRCEQVA